MLRLLKPALAMARIGAGAPGPGVLGPVPPTALTLMCTAVIPCDFATSEAADALLLAAKADDSNLSAFTCLPTDEKAMVSAPVRSVMWTIVLL